MKQKTIEVMRSPVDYVFASASGHGTLRSGRTEPSNLIAVLPIEGLHNTQQHRLGGGVRRGKALDGRWQLQRL